jgi:hypothetical protein
MWHTHLRSYIVRQYNAQQISQINLLGFKGFLEKIRCQLCWGVPLTVVLLRILLFIFTTPIYSTQYITLAVANTFIRDWNSCKGVHNSLIAALPSVLVSKVSASRMGNRISFRQNSAECRLRTISIIPKKVLIPRHSEVWKSLERKEMTWTKLVLQKIILQQTKLTTCFVWDMLRKGIPRLCFNGISNCFSFVEWFRTEFQVLASIFVLRNWILSCFLLCGMVQNRIPRVCFYFYPWYRITSTFLLCATVWNGLPRVFCSAEQPQFRRNKQIVSTIPSSAE